MTPDIFKVRLAEAMEEKSVTQADLVRTCDDIDPDAKVIRSDVSRYLSGQSVPRPGKLEVIAIALDVPVDWLAGDAGHGYTVGVETSIRFLCEASDKPEVYKHILAGGKTYIICVSPVREDTVTWAASLFRIVCTVLSDVRSIALSFHAIKAIKDRGIERQMLERLLCPDKQKIPRVRRESTWIRPIEPKPEE